MPIITGLSITNKNDEIKENIEFVSNVNSINTVYLNSKNNTIKMKALDTTSDILKYKYISYSDGIRLYKNNVIENVGKCRLSYVDSISQIKLGDNIFFDYTIYLKSASELENIEFNDVNINYNYIKIDNTTYRIYGYFRITKYMISGIDDGRLYPYDQMRFIDIGFEYKNVESIIENDFSINPTLTQGTFEDSININVFHEAFYIIYVIDKANNISDYCVSLLIKISDSSYEAKNIIVNGGFENGLSNWSSSSNSINVTGQEKSLGQYSLELKSNSKNYLEQSINAPILGHLYYHAFDFKSSKIFSTEEGRNEIFHTDDEGGQMYIQKKFQFELWTRVSKIQMINTETYLSNKWIYRILQIGSNGPSHVDNVIVIDLTATFGSGNEPDKEWCDKHINYFDGTTTIYK